MAIFRTFDSQNTATDRPFTKIWFEQISHSRSVAYSSRLISLYIFFEKQNVILRILL